MHIIELKIKNFRGIKSFHHVFGEKQLVCFVGQGDSGKTTLLDAISLVLSPNWNIPFCDNDFYLKNIEEPINIEVSLKIPESFVLESKFGLYMRFWDSENNTISDIPIDKGSKILTIKLEVKENLEPKWYVYNNCQEDNYKEISNVDRAKFNCFMISDYTDKHFSWTQGSPLNALIPSKELHSTKNNSIEPLRTALNIINANDFETFNKAFSENVITHIVDTEGIKTLMDSREIYYNQNKLSLHDRNGIPFRAKGKGTRRLLSAALQFANKQDGSITLIDELEQGLEPYRVKTFVRELKNELSNKHQIFITTHSSNVITEIKANNIVVLRNNNGELSAIDVSEDLQNIVRAFPGIAIREELTDEWKNRGIKEGKEYSILTAEISKATFGLTPSEYKDLKGLDRENLRDHMTDLELIFTMLGEASTKEIAQNTDAQGFQENKTAAQKGGKIAGDARKQLEIESGKKVVTSENYLPYLNSKVIDDKNE